MSPLLHWKRISCSIVKGAEAAFDTFTCYSAEFETIFIYALGDEKLIKGDGEGWWGRDVMVRGMMAYAEWSAVTRYAP